MIKEHMMFDESLPPSEVLYAALVARAPSFEGRAYVGVATTGIYCRLTCPARKPKPENCRWFGSAPAAAQAGFRPCMRCHPMGPQASHDPVVTKLLDRLNADPARRWYEGDIAAMGIDPTTARRAFRRHFGITFLEMARQARLRAGVARMQTGDKVIEAQLDAGFESASGFRQAFSRLFGHAPHQLTGQAELVTDWLDTPLGGMIAVADPERLHLLEFTGRKALSTELKRLSKGAKGRIGFGRTKVMDQLETQLSQYFSGQDAQFSVPLALHGTPFQRDVWQHLQQIPAGQTQSYSQLATSIGNPAAVRAVARANGANQIAVLIPCHRVIGADGTMTGYGGGIWRKEKLIEIEHSYRHDQ